MKKTLSSLFVAVLFMAMSNFAFSQVRVTPTSTDYPDFVTAFAAIQAGTHGAAPTATVIGSFSQTAGAILTNNTPTAITSLNIYTSGVFTVTGAWAQNIDEDDKYIDFMGDKGGIRLQYGGDFTLYTVEHGALVKYTPELQTKNMFETEINSFVRCVRTGEKLPSHIDTAVLTSQIMQAIYDSAETHREVVL